MKQSQRSPVRLAPKNYHLNNEQRLPQKLANIDHGSSNVTGAVIRQDLETAAAKARGLCDIKIFRFVIYGLICIFIFGLLIDFLTVSNKEAIIRVLKADDRLAIQRSQGLDNGTDIKQVHQDYVRQIRQIPLDNCPSDFRVAFTDHVNAWDDLVGRVSKPALETILESVVRGLAGQLDGGASKIYDSEEELQKSWHEVLSVAQKHGADTSKIGN